MKLINKKLCVLACAFFFATSAWAETHEIKGAGVKFKPMFVYAQPGDVIAFRNMATHFVNSLDGLTPEGITPMKSDIGKDYDYKVEKEGVYMFKCPPHWGVRMGGAIVVGNPADLDKILADYSAKAGADKTLKPAVGLLKKLTKDLQGKGKLK